MPGAGVSHWWPTPARPDDHFSAEELARSAELHRPLRRLRLVRIGAQGALLIGASLVIGRVAALDTAGAGPVGTVGAADRWTRALVGAGAVVASLGTVDVVVVRILAPRALAGPPGGDPGPDRALLGVLAPLVPAALVAGLLLGPLTDPDRGWLVVALVVAAVVVLSVASTAARTRRSSPIEAPRTWPALAARSGVAGEVGFGLLPEADRPSSPNACAVGLGRSRWILVDRSLLDAPLADFVVAHELTHLAARHPLVQLALNGVAALASVAAVPALAPTGWPWSLFGLAPGDPQSLPVAALVVGAATLVVRIPVAWVLRALERVADDGAVALVGVPERSELRALHLGSGSDLDPPTWAALVAVHPSPVERLEYLDRRRR